MLYSMGLRGRFQKLAYPYYGYVGNPPFAPAAVMRRFLMGERGARISPGVGVSIDFDAYNVDKMINLLEQAYARSMRRDASGRLMRWEGVPASHLNTELITKELIDVATGEPIRVINAATGAEADPVVGRKYLEFIASLLSEPNEYFALSTDPTHPEDFRPTREFWLYILRKYNYILP
jgi:hypothetical protein